MNCHNCTTKCRSYGGKCKYAFPRYPLIETLVIDRDEKKDSSETQNDKNDNYRKILNDVEDILNDSELIQFIMDQYEKGTTQEEYVNNRSARNDLLLKLAGPIEYEDYVKAIKHNR